MNRLSVYVICGIIFLTFSNKQAIGVDQGEASTSAYLDHYSAVSDGYLEDLIDLVYQSIKECEGQEPLPYSYDVYLQVDIDTTIFNDHISLQMNTPPYVTTYGNDFTNLFVVIKEHEPENQYVIYINQYEQARVYSFSPNCPKKREEYIEEEIDEE